jgi:hypothetical protein
MPFVETYSVNFANGNLQPHLNVLNWPALELSNSDDTESDAFGRTLKLTRDDEKDGAHNSVALIPPAGFPLDVRMWLRVSFDLPFASRLPEAPEGINPEAWAVALRVSPKAQLLDNDTFDVTCQFTRGSGGGVRLNTPANSLPEEPRRGTLQRDQAAFLESPLDYNRYQGGLIALPFGTGPFVEVDPPLFTLEHSFCGWNFRNNGHTVGAGFLRINRPPIERAPWPLEVRDHRVYSSDTLKFALSDETFVQARIRAVGVSLATRMGLGNMSVRLRSLQVWFNDSMSVSDVENLASASALGSS